MIKSSFLALVCLLLANVTLNAQKNPVGKVFISSGVGLISSYTRTDNSDNKPALTFEMGYRISSLFSINAHVGYIKATGTPQYLLDGKLSQTTNQTTMIGLKNQFHKGITKNFELYGGFLLGYSSFKVEERDMTTREKIVRTENTPTKINPNASDGQFLYAGFIGGKLWITPNVGGFVEASSGISILSTGLSVQF